MSNPTASDTTAGSSSVPPGRPPSRLGEQEAEDILVDAAARARRRSVTIETAAKPIATLAPAVLKKFQPASEERIREAMENQERYKRQTAIEDARSRRNLPSRYQNASLSHFEGLPADVREAYADAVDRVSALLDRPGTMAMHGDVGTGKTHIACALINAFCRAGRSATYLKTADYINEVRATWLRGATKTEKEVIHAYKRFSLLVLDEWKPRDSELTAAEALHIFRLMDARYDEGVSTLMLSNHLTTADFTRSIDRRIADRMHDGGGVVFCDWASLRGRLTGSDNETRRK